MVAKELRSRERSCSRERPGLELPEGLWSLFFNQIFRPETNLNPYYVKLFSVLSLRGRSTCMSRE